MGPGEPSRPPGRDPGPWPATRASAAPLILSTPCAHPRTQCRGSLLRPTMGQSDYSFHFSHSTHLGRSRGRKAQKPCRCPIRNAFHAGDFLRWQREVRGCSASTASTYSETLRALLTRVVTRLARAPLPQAAHADRRCTRHGERSGNATRGLGCLRVNEPTCPCAEAVPCLLRPHVCPTPRHGERWRPLHNPGDVAPACLCRGPRTRVVPGAQPLTEHQSASTAWFDARDMCFYLLSHSLPVLDR